MLYKQIKEELKEAMLAQDTLKMTVLRMLIAAITNEMISKGKDEEKITDEETLAVIRRGVKQRKDSIEQFEKGGRKDLVKSEEKEMKLLEKYLPKMMDKKEIEKVAEKKMKELKVTDKAKIGILVGAIMKELKGKADGNDVKEVVEKLFE